MMSARCMKLLKLPMRQENSEDLAVNQCMRERIPLAQMQSLPSPSGTLVAQQDILSSLPGPSGTAVAHQDILQSLPDPSSNRAYSSDDDVQDCNWLPAGTHDEHVSSSSSSKTSTPRSIGSIAVPALVSQTQDNVRRKRKRCVGMMQKKLRKERTEKIKKGEEYINQAGKKILDTCPGKTRNKTLPVVYNYILTQKVGLKTIDHKFLVPGHTHLECDADHASIERAKKKYNGRISIPNDWYMLVSMVSSETIEETSTVGKSGLEGVLKRELEKELVMKGQVEQE
ncbi:unnamed protein product [Parnassius mnemosyne]|uniref:Uncharacterized protein n=1 Tax=Parnassius mnemosyne TaxID=213953 RepID=A0AAV1KAU5_9NEOP